MQTARRAAFVLLIVWLAPLAVNAQAEVLSPKAQALAVALAKLKEHPNDFAAQEYYLDTFPRNYNEFLQLFDLDRELYFDSHDYISILPSLAKTHELQVGQLLVGLSKNAHYEADAPGDLRDVTTEYGSEHTKIFARLLLRLSATDRAHEITFLADAENFGGYPDFQKLIDNLKSLGQQQLARAFETARTKRKKQPHD